MWYDVEEQAMFNCGVEELTAIINAFCEVIENAGYQAGVYMSSYPAQRYVDMDAIPYYKWIAQYNYQIDYPGQYDIWQYSSSEYISGISENSVDTNYCYTDFSVKTDTPNRYDWIFDDNTQKWGLKLNGNWVYDRWVQIDLKWYAINKQGWLITQGWYKEGDYWYYLDKQKGEMATGWLWLDDEYGKAYYYFDENGRLIQDVWQWDEQTQGWYYLKYDGKMATKQFVNAPDEVSRYWTNENGKWQK